MQLPNIKTPQIVKDALAWLHRETTTRKFNVGKITFTAVIAPISFSLNPQLIKLEGEIIGYVDMTGLFGRPKVVTAEEQFEKFLERGQKTGFITDPQTSILYRVERFQQFVKDSVPHTVEVKVFGTTLASWEAHYNVAPFGTPCQEVPLGSVIPPSAYSGHPGEPGAGLSAGF